MALACDNSTVHPHDRAPGLPSDALRGRGEDRGLAKTWSSSDQHSAFAIGYGVGDLLKEPVSWGGSCNKHVARLTDFTLWRQPA